MSHAPLRTMFRPLRRAQDRGYRSTVAEHCFAHSATDGDLSLCMYDVTTLCFEAEHEGALRKVGFSKERRVDPQIVVGLLVVRHGFPLEIGCLEGNRAVKLTIVPIVQQFIDRHQLADLVIVAGAGCYPLPISKPWTKLTWFIVGSRTTKVPVDLESHFRWRGDAFDDGQMIDTLGCCRQTT